MIIALEGIDTVGKSTQIDLLKDEFSRYSYVGEPAKEYLVESTIREYINSDDVVFDNVLIFLFLANRADFYNRHVIKKIKNGEDIFTDRSMISAIGYALLYYNDIDTLIKINKYATSNYIPNKIIILKTDKDLLLKRLNSKKIDAIEQKGVDNLLKIQENIVLTTKKLNINHIIIDASLSKIDINKKIKEYILHE